MLPNRRCVDVPAFAALAGHPVRWRLLAELAVSDRHVAELTTLVEAPQALVSYHLGRLRAAGLVGARRSSFDGRASYYRLDLQRCGEELASVGQALHPGLRFRPTPVDTVSTKADRAKVLFACTGNGARSQIAEALLQHLAGDRMLVASGGSHPKPIHPNAIRVLADRGIDISDRQSKSLTIFDPSDFDVIVTLCDKVREACPDFSGHAHAIHWSIEDPSLPGLPHRSTLPAFRALAAELEARIGFLIAIVDDVVAARINMHRQPRRVRHGRS